MNCHINIYLASCLLMGVMLCSCGDPLGVKEKTPEQDVPVKDPSSDYVDLGLSVKWGTCNIGSDTPSKGGNYYSWGETETKSEFSNKSYKFYDIMYDLEGLFTINKYTKEDGDVCLDPEDDVVTKTLANGKHPHWRMPTKDEWQELIDNCEWTILYSENGTHNIVVASRNGQKLYFPCDGALKRNPGGENLPYGFYWTSSCSKSEAFCAALFAETKRTIEKGTRSNGMYVRGVYDEQ